MATVEYKACDICRVPESAAGILRPVRVSMAHEVYLDSEEICDACRQELQSVLDQWQKLAQERGQTIKLLLLQDRRL